MVAKLHGTTSTRWDKLSQYYRRHHPLCEPCLKQGRITAAAAVDHITPHKGQAHLLFAMDNLQSICIPCHNAHKQSIERRGYDKAIGMDGWPVATNHPNYNFKIK